MKKAISINYYGKIFKAAKEIANREGIFIYTVIDCEDEEAWLCKGWHFVNRIGYYFTTKKIEIPEERRFKILVGGTSNYVQCKGICEKNKEYKDANNIALNLYKELKDISNEIDLEDVKKLSYQEVKEFLS